MRDIDRQLFVLIANEELSPEDRLSQMQELIKQEDGANINAIHDGIDDARMNSYTPLMLAAACDNSTAVEFLLEHGADATITVNIPSEAEGQPDSQITALWMAIGEDGDTASFPTFLKYAERYFQPAQEEEKQVSGRTDPRTFLTHKCNGVTILSKLASVGAGGKVNKLLAISEHIPDILAQNDNRTTAFAHANNKDMYNTLLQQGLRPTVSDIDKITNPYKITAFLKALLDSQIIEIDDGIASARENDRGIMNQGSIEAINNLITRGRQQEAIARMEGQEWQVIDGAFVEEEMKRRENRDIEGKEGGSRSSSDR